MIEDTIELLEPEEDRLAGAAAHDIVFWNPKYNTPKEGKRYIVDVYIDYLKMLDLFRLLGFLRYDVNVKTRVLVRIENSRIVHRSDSTLVTDAFFDHLDEKDEFLDEYDTLSRDYLKGKIMKSLSTYFKEEKLYRLRPAKPIELNKDTADIKFFYYKNGFVEVTKDGTRFNDYSKLPGYIWNTEILNRNYLEPIAGKTSVYEKFITQLCLANGEESPSRLQSLKQIIGYLLHSYTEYKLTAILMTDSKMSDDGEANGRSGKTLFTRGLGWMLSADPRTSEIPTFIDINGKDFDPTVSKKYQMVGLETKIICFNDLKRYFDVECLYNDVAEGVTVEQKFMNPFKVQAKMILNSNKTVRVDGDSSKDRFLEFQVSDHFSRKHTPAMEFKHWFFKDWDANEWALFDSFMFSCVTEFFTNDSRITEPEQINLDVRKLHENTKPEFIDFMEDQNFEFDLLYNRKDLYHKFITRYEDFANDKKFTQAKFTTWINTYTKFHPDYEPYNKARDEKRNDGVIEFSFRKARTGMGSAINEDMP